MTETLCACGCGVFTRGGKFIPGHHMRTAEAKERMSRDRPARDLTGLRVHKLTVLAWVGWQPSAKGGEWTWNCQCDCGNQCVVAQRYLVGGHTKSCGCIVGKHKRTHGATVGGKATPEFMAWVAIHQRCENSKLNGYANYGGRGIRVCERWSSFENFLEDMGPRPSAAHSIDRYPGNDGDYEPGNCRWATMREQSNNRRSNTPVTFEGRTQNAAEWERELGLPPGTVVPRLAQGWTPAEALTIRNGHQTRRASLVRKRRNAHVTPMDLAVLSFIRSELASGHAAPRQRDIQARFGYASKNSASQYLRRLERHGFIKLVSRSEGRIQLVEGA